MWTIEPQEPYERRRKKWPVKHKRELLAVHDNFDTFLKALNGGQKSAAARFGFIHPEPEGVLAIDQKGGGPHLKETRLYIFPDEESERVFLITLGDKDSQSQDLRTCKDFVVEFRSTPKPQPSNQEESDAQE